MKSSHCAISTCKNCQCFRAEGRRGGTCEQLNTFAAPDWKACPLAIPAFESLESNLEGYGQVPSPLVVLEHSFALELSNKPAHDVSAYLEAS